MGGSTVWRLASPLRSWVGVLACMGIAVFATDAGAARNVTPAQLVTRDAVVTSGRSFELELRCPGSARSCEGKLALRELRSLAPVSATAAPARPKKRTNLLLARGDATLVGGASTTVGLKLTRKGFKRVRRRGPIVARVVLSGRDATGRPVRLRRKVRISVPPRQKPSLLIGVAGDRVQGAPAHTAQLARDLNVGAIRVLFLWRPGQSGLRPAQVATLAGIVSSTPDLRIVFSSRAQSGKDAPTTDAARAAFCGFLGDVAARFPTISDFVVWQEPNKQQFWAPQYDAGGESVAPAAYAQLLAHCYDVLHSVRGDVNVIGPSTASKGNDRPNARSNISHAPGTFIRLMGDTYRASARTAPLFDTFGHHPYGTHSAERPWQRHTRSLTIGLGDWSALMQSIYDGFEGTPQPLPGIDGPQIWYLEGGFQSRPPEAKAGLYTGAETDAWSLPDRLEAGDVNPAAPLAPDLATQLTDTIKLAYCQPYVAAQFNFQLYDEPDLDRWQSGVFYTDGSAKAAAVAYQEAAGAAAAGKIRCANLKGGAVDRVFVPRTSVGVTRIGWARATRFNHKHDLWRAQLRVDEPVTYVATIVPVEQRGTSATTTGAAQHSTEGSLRAGFYSWIKFPRERLTPGLYRIEVAVTSVAKASRTATLDGPVFQVRGKSVRSAG